MGVVVGGLVEGKLDDRSQPALAFLTRLVVFTNHYFWVPYAIVFIALLFNQAGWVITSFMPALSQLIAFAWLAVIPFLILVYIPKRRTFGGLGFVLLSSVFTMTFSCYCALIVFQNWSKVGLVLGTLGVGYGIMPCAIISELLCGRWGAALTDVANVVLIIVSKHSGYGVTMTSLDKEPDEEGRRFLSALAISGCTLVFVLDTALPYIGQRYPALFSGQ